MAKLTSPYDDDIKNQESILYDVKANLIKLRQLRAEFHCPYQVGQQLVNKGGRAAVIATIKPGYGKGYELNAYYILKDGKTDAVAHTLYDWHGWVKA